MRLLPLFLASAMLVASSAYADTWCTVQPLTSTVPQPNPAGGVIGYTNVEINTNYPIVIENNLKKNARVILARLSPRELTDMLTVYAQTSHGSTVLRESLALQVDAAMLAKVDALTGAGVISDVLPYDLTPFEIYMDFRTAPVGSLSAAGALWESGVTLATGVGQAFAVGATIGTWMNWLISTYDPALYDKIGGTVAGSLTQIEDATTILSQGDLEGSLDALFGLPVPVKSVGDFDASIYMFDYESGGGSSGC